MSDVPERSERSVSSATVRLDRADRYAKQLTSHMSRRFGGEWSAETQRGWIDLDVGRAVLETTEGELRLRLEAPAMELDRLEDALGLHLVRFAASHVPDVVVTWTRGDGTPGTQQGPA